MGYVFFSCAVYSVVIARCSKSGELGRYKSMHVANDSTAAEEQALRTREEVHMPPGMIEMGWAPPRTFERFSYGLLQICEIPLAVL